MKKILFIISLIGVLSSCSQKEDNFNINGELKGMRKGIVYLERDVDGRVSIVDSIFMKGTEKFTFKGNIESPEVFFLKTSRKNSATLALFVEKGDLNITADVSDIMGAKVEGSENQKLLEQFNQMVGKFNFKENELYVDALKASADKNTAKQAEISENYRKNQVRKTRYILNYAVVNASKDISPYIALNYLGTSDITVLDTINNSISSEVKAGLYGRELNEFVTQIKATKVGGQCPKITQRDSSGTKHILKNEKGYLLLNFWASGHANSRTLNKLTNRIYENHSEEYIKIISVSTDTNKEDWINAVNEDKLPWLQVSDLKGIKNEAVRMLAIKVIPDNVLIDKNGIIVGRNITIEEISKLIEK